MIEALILNKEEILSRAVGNGRGERRPGHRPLCFELG